MNAIDSLKDAMNNAGSAQLGDDGASQDERWAEKYGKPADAPLNDWRAECAVLDKINDLAMTAAGDLLTRLLNDAHSSGLVLGDRARFFGCVVTSIIASLAASTTRSFPSAGPLAGEMVWQEILSRVAMARAGAGAYVAVELDPDTGKEVGKRRRFDPKPN